MLPCRLWRLPLGADNRMGTTAPMVDSFTASVQIFGLTFVAMIGYTVHDKRRADSVMSVGTVRPPKRLTVPA
jgi:hypothetical protein